MECRENNKNWCKGGVTDLDTSICNVIFCKVALDQDFLWDVEVKSGVLKILN